VMTLLAWWFVLRTTLLQAMSTGPRRTCQGGRSDGASDWPAIAVSGRSRGPRRATHQRDRALQAQGVPCGLIDALLVLTSVV